MLQDIDPRHIPETGRYKELAKLEAYLAGEQYDALDDWYDAASDKPARERRPCVIYPLPKAAVNQAVRFAIGEGKFPRLKIDEVEAEDALAPALVLNKDQAKRLTESLEDVVKRSTFRSALRVMMRRGLSARTGVTAFSVKNGRFSFEHPRAKDCIPTFIDGDPDGAVQALIWSYQYDDIVPDRDGRPETKRYAFRRDYDATNVTQYKPTFVEVGRKIEWTVETVEAHGLGFCPIVWTRNLADDCGSSVDGVALIDGLLDEIDALNYALSKRHQGIDVLGTPQPYETGVKDGDGPGLAGRTAAPRPGDKRAPGFSARTSARPARKTGPDFLWSYEGSEVKVGVFETTGKAFEVASAHVNDIRGRLLEAMDVILLDPQAVAGKGDMSAKALALMYAPMLALVDELREWWWERAIVPLLNMMLRAISILGPKILVKGAGKMQKLLAARTIQVDGKSHWEPPSIEPLWGEYFAPSAEETDLTVKAAVGAKSGGLVSAETATRYVANLFAVAEVEPELKSIDEEKQVATEQAIATAQATRPAPPNTAASRTPKTSSKASSKASSKKPKRAKE